MVKIDRHKHGIEKYEKLLIPVVRLNGKTMAQTFWERVDIVDQDRCWEYRGYKTKGYGVLNRRGYALSAHRIAFFLHTGEVPALVMHTCDNPACCNPRHLKAGSISENALDMYKKNRANWIPRALASRKYPEYMLRAVTVLLERGDLKASEISRFIGMPTSNVFSNIS